MKRVLKKYYGKVFAKEIAEKLGISVTAVIDKANALKLAPPRAEFYTASELEFIKKSYPSLEAKQIAKKLGRNEEAIRTLAYKKGWKGRKNITNILTSKQLSFILNNYKKMKAVELAKNIGATQNQVMVVARRFGLQEKKVAFTRKEQNFIAKNRNILSIKEIAQHLGKGEYSIRYYAQTKGWVFKVRKPTKTTSTANAKQSISK
jgi:hypothetical protein